MTITSHHLLSRYLIGMPHLSAVGLSEQWLLKECGHQHWLALAQACGKLVPEFYDRQGHKVYAAFVCVEVNNARLDDIKENDELDMATELTRLSASRSMSSHVLMKADRVIARVMMVSTFVYRQERGNNQSVAKAELHTIGPVQENHPLSAQAFKLLKNHKQHRHDSPAAGESFRYQPCPYSDFNGADFLYFAAFQQIADRAESLLMADLHHHQNLWVTRQRSLCYYGNLNIGDSVYVQVARQQISDSTLKHRLQLRRASDDALLLVVITEKKAVAHAMLKSGELTQAVG